MPDHRCEQAEWSRRFPILPNGLEAPQTASSLVAPHCGSAAGVQWIPWILQRLSHAAERVEGCGA